MILIYYSTIILANQHDSLEYEPQRAFALEMASQITWASSVTKYLETNQNTIVVTEEHLAVLFRLVVEYGSQATEDDTKVYDTLLRALLMLNSISSAETVADGDLETFVRVEMRSFTYDTEQTRDVIERYSQFIDWSNSQAGLNSANHLDLKSDMH